MGLRGAALVPGYAGASPCPDAEVASLLLRSNNLRATLLLKRQALHFYASVAHKATAKPVLTALC